MFALLDWRGVNLSKLASHGNFSSGQSAGFSAFALSLLMGAWCLTGFEAAADLAEEMHDPRRTVPRQCSLLAGFRAFGFLLLVGIVLSIDDVRATQGQDSPLISVLQQRFGPHWLLAALVVVAVSIFACAIASMAAASRLLFSLSRDGMLPGARWLSRIDPHRSTPRNAVILVWLLSTAIVLLLRQTDLISSVSAVAGYLGYAGIILAALLAGPLVIAGARLDSLRWLALMWALSLVLALTVPPTDIPGWNDKYLPAKATAFALMAGSAVYFGLIKRRIREGLAGPPQLSDKGSETRP
ncbi:MAG: APC family permease [Acidobacteria bacterium]|nr:APC family permease [Acidobacteriota bacterium]